MLAKVYVRWLFVFLIMLHPLKAAIEFDISTGKIVTAILLIAGAWVGLKLYNENLKFKEDHSQYTRDIQGFVDEYSFYTPYNFVQTAYLPSTQIDEFQKKEIHRWMRDQTLDEQKINVWDNIIIRRKAHTWENQLFLHFLPAGRELRRQLNEDTLRIRFLRELVHSFRLQNRN